MEAVVRVLQVQSSCPPSDGHHERFINWLPPFLFAVLAHNVDHKFHARTSAMQGLTLVALFDAPRRRSLATRWFAAETFTLQSRHTASINLWCLSSRSLTCADPRLCRFQLWRSLCRETASSFPPVQHFRRLSLWLSVVCAELAPATLCLARYGGFL